MDLVMKSIVIICLLICVPDSTRSKRQEACQKNATIGTNNTEKYQADSDSYSTRLYLNTAEPATCSGLVKNWTFCYYVPLDVDSMDIYRAEFGLYRKVDTHGSWMFYRQSSFVKIPITIAAGDGEYEPNYDHGSIGSDRNLKCAVFTPEESIAVGRGDILGVCLSGERRLEIVSDTEDAEYHDDVIHFTDFDAHDCDYIPSLILDPEETTHKVVHLFAEIVAPKQASVTQIVSLHFKSLLTVTHQQSISSTTDTFQPIIPTMLPRPPNSQSFLINRRIIILVLTLVSIIVIILVLFLVFYLRKYKMKRRYRFFPPQQSSIKKVNFDEDYSGTLANFDNVIYSNYDEAVELPLPATRQRDYASIENREAGLMNNTATVFSELQVDVNDNDSTLNSSSEVEPRIQKIMASVYSELHSDLEGSHCTSHNYSAIESDKSYMHSQQDAPEDTSYSCPERNCLFRAFLAPASKESELYAQLKFCGVKSIPREAIEITDYLGSGQFGDVQKGVWKKENLEVQIALKTLKQGSKKGQKVKFLQEAATMAQFSHPNIIVLYGVVNKGEPMMLVVEWVEKGSLSNHLNLLKENHRKTPLPNLANMLLNFSQQVALGMKYLSEKGFVHRDLAARNILVSSDNVCKIADFGMSRDLADDNYYVSHGGVIPVKWTAPEAISYKKYSTASDVWSYGCLLYEIWSLGHKPYKHISNMQVVRHVEDGHRLPPPPGCPKKIYELMIFCWNPDFRFRPKFADLSFELMCDREELLDVPLKALESHRQAACLGADLEAGEGMYKDLQSRYVLK